MKQRKTASLMLQVYALFAILYVFFKQMIDLNYLVVLAFCLTYTRYVRINSYFVSGIFSIIIILFSYLNGVDILHIVIDCGVIFYVVSSVDLLSLVYLKEKRLKAFTSFLLLLVIASLINIYNPLLWETKGIDRYLGIFSSCNSSASMFAIFSILIWEVQKKYHFFKIKGIYLLFFFIASLALYFLASKTRSLLFVFPYWVFQFYQSIGLKKFVFVSLLVIPYIGYILFYIQDNGRVKEDDSFNTRLGLYLMQIEGIIDNYIILPHGANAAMEMVRYRLDETYSPHNDFLRYIYDWGGVFFLIVFYIIRKIIKCVKIDLNLIVIFIAYLPFTLHNLLFAPIVWIPLIIILILYEHKYSRDEEDVSCCTEIQ